jgi:KEOPS complex subunit Cgi121
MKIVHGQVRVGREFEGAGAFPDVAAVLEELDAIAESTGSTIQAFDARYVAGEEHLQTAVEHALRSRRRGEFIADDQAVEMLLYAAGRRQIDQAMEMGVKPGEQPVAVVIDGGEETQAAEAVGSLLGSPGSGPDAERITSFFGISAKEREATDADLEELVCERVALLDVEK